MAHNRKVYGQWQTNLPSRFINELPPANIEICNRSNNFFSSNEYYSTQFQETNHNARSFYRNTNCNGRYIPTSSSIVGTKVYHQTFGYGKVISQEGNAFQVCFENGTIKKLLGSYLTKIS